MELDEAQALMWRLRRHSLASAQESEIAEVVERMVALRAWPERSAETAIRIRRSNPARQSNPAGRVDAAGPSGSKTGMLADAQESSSIIRSYALRGGSYFFTPASGANLLSVRTATKVWRSPRFQKQGSFAIDDWEPVREAVHEACLLGPRTREEISTHVQTVPSLRHLKEGLSGAGADSLYKPLHWWGDICFGPIRDGQATFRWLRDDPAWPGLPPVEEAGVQAITDYAHSYGPVTRENLHYWFTEGLGVRRAQLDEWLAVMADILVPVTMTGGDAGVGASGDAFILSADLTAILSTVQEESLLLLPGFDPWLMGPGTSDSRIIAPQRRAVASRGANTIVHNGIVAGVWKATAHDVRLHWFDEAGPIPRPLLDDQVRALGESLGRDLTPVLAAD